MLAILLLALGIFSRLIVHVPNFTPVIALSLFAGVYMSKEKALIVPLVLLFLSDIIIGFHETMLYTYGSIFLISWIGIWLKDRKNFQTIALTGFGSSVLFFVITNLGVWLASGLYPMTAAGLRDCFILAVPFFKTEVLSTFIYAVVFFGGYEFLAARIKSTRFANVLS